MRTFILGARLFRDYNAHYKLFATVMSMERAPRGRRPNRRFRGKLLRELREAEGLTQQEFADIVGATRFAVSKWETETDNPKTDAVYRIADHFQKSSHFFYDQGEQLPINASVVLGHLASFTQCAQTVVHATRQLLVFQTLGAKAPTWWREKLRDHLISAEPKIEYRIVLCIDPKTVTHEQLLGIKNAEKEFAGAPIDTYVFEQKPQLGIDVLIVDNYYCFLAIHSPHRLETRQCSIYLESEEVSRALSRWLLDLQPLREIRTWVAEQEKRFN